MHIFSCSSTHQLPFSFLTVQTNKQKNCIWKIDRFYRYMFFSASAIIFNKLLICSWLIQFKTVTKLFVPLWNKNKICLVFGFWLCENSKAVTNSWETILTKKKIIVNTSWPKNFYMMIFTCINSSIYIRLYMQSY